MLGNMLKSCSSIDELDTWRVYLAYVLAGTSAPLYQSTISLVTTSWFPQQERNAATRVAVYSNQFGVFLAFVFGILLVSSSDDVLPYFHLLSVMSTVTFVGCAMQFSDCPPTPPSQTARVIRGSVERPIFARGVNKSPLLAKRSPNANSQRKTLGGSKSSSFRSTLLLPSPSFGSTDKGLRLSEYDNLLEAPSSASGLAMENITEPVETITSLSGTVQSYSTFQSSYASTTDTSLLGSRFANTTSVNDISAMSSPFPHLRAEEALRGHSHAEHEYYSYNFDREIFQPKIYLPPTEDDGAEPIIVQTPRQLDVDICRDQIYRSLRACFARKGFSRCVLSFATSGSVINTLSTFMGYLVTLNGAGLKPVGIVGGIFQLVVIFSSILCGSCTTIKPLRYYMIIIALLALGALALGLCSANLDSQERLWVNLLMVAAFLSPLQPLSTQLA